MPSAATIEKARRIVDEGSVHELDARAFAVRGDHSLYVVVLRNDGTDHCTCQSYRTCSHILAAREALEPVDAGVVD